MSRVIDWHLAERVAESSATIGGLTLVPGVGDSPAADSLRYLPEDLELACAEALEAAAACAGLGAVAEPPAPELIGRRAWAIDALATFAEAGEPLEQRLHSELSLPGPLGHVARRGIGGALALELGLATGYAARHVLGQYDVSLLGPPRPPRLLFIGENMEAARRKLDAEPALFLRWIALHECTHVVQFERVPWLAPHLRALLIGLVEGAADGFDSGSIRGGAARLVREPRELAAALLRGELVQLLADPERRALLDRLQATMAVVEGHAEHVMDECAADAPGLASLRSRLDARRADRGGLGGLIARLLGMEMKLRQYELGKVFWDTVIAAEPDAGAFIWSAPEALPDLAELEDPSRWLSRHPARA